MIECIYYYPMKHKENAPQWIIGHMGFRFTNWKITFSDCVLVRGKDDQPCFITPPQKKYTDKQGKTRYMWYWKMEDDDMFQQFQQLGKDAIIAFCKERDLEIPEELCESS